jgi:hypothetical protein
MGGSDGSFTVEVQAGQHLTIQEGTGEFGPSGTFGSLSIGTYQVTVRDINLCTFELSVTINQPDEELVARLFHRTMYCATVKPTERNSGGWVYPAF